MELDLNGIAACLHVRLSLITQLSIQLKENETSMYHSLTFSNPKQVAAAASAVRLLGPLCTALTHITVCSTMPETPSSCSPLLNAVKAVCAASLTHLSFTMPSKTPSQMTCFGVSGTSPRDMMTTSLEQGCEFTLDNSACDALRSQNSHTCTWDAVR